MGQTATDLRYYEKIECLPARGNITLRVVGDIEAPNARLKEGSCGDDLWQLQQALAFLGFLNPSSVGGQWDCPTEDALKAFQRSVNLKADADYGGQSQAALEIALGGGQKSPEAERKRYDYFKKVIEGVGTFETGVNYMNVIGVRSLSNHKKVTNTQNAYDDSIYVLWLDAGGEKHCEHFKATVDPGKFAKYYNAKGDAHLVDGQYKYKVGTHKGYAALNQAEKVCIWRDKNKDGDQDADETTEYWGYYGINIHAGGTTDNVGNWSAGCQVIWGGKTGVPYKRFMTLMNTDPDKKMFYTLVDSSDLSGNVPT